jgi:hypothetical protein
VIPVFSGEYAVIVGGGDVSDLLLPFVRGASMIIAADSGAEFLESHGLTPGIFVGDFDSCGRETVCRVRASGCRGSLSPCRKRRDRQRGGVEHRLCRGLQVGSRNRCFGRRPDRTRDCQSPVGRALRRTRYGCRPRLAKDLDLPRERSRIRRLHQEGLPGQKRRLGFAFPNHRERQRSHYREPEVPSLTSYPHAGHDSRRIQSDARRRRGCIR